MKNKNIFLLITSLVVISVLSFFVASELLPKQKDSGAGTTSIYYISTTGKDTNPGTVDLPYLTYAAVDAKLKPGDTVYFMNGIYSLPVTINASGSATQRIKITAAPGQTPVIDVAKKSNYTTLVKGSYIDISNISFKNSSNRCLHLSGSYITAKNVVVTGCVSHGLVVSGTNIVVDGSEIYGSVLENSNTAVDNPWGSGLKVEMGGDTITIKNNKVYRNFGEGIAITRGKNVVVYNNYVYDNFSVNLYVDNSSGITLDSNYLTSSTGTTYDRNGFHATGIMFGIETYSGWGNQFDNVVVKNNVVVGTGFGILFSGAEVTNGALKNLSIVNNTIVNTQTTALSLAGSTYTSNVKIQNNIFTQSGTRQAYIKDKTGMTFSNNLWNKKPAYPLATSTSDVIGDPLFVSTPNNTDKNRVKLQPSSPAINKGVNTGITVDAFGLARPSGAGYDIGAHEYGGADTTTPPVTPTPTPTVVKLYPTEDTYVSSSAPTTVNGTKTGAVVDGSPVSIALFKFNLSTLAGKTVKKAELKLYATDGAPNTTIQKIYRTAIGSWGENRTYYNNRPKLYEQLAVLRGGATGSIVKFDVLTPVKAQAGSGIAFGITSSYSNGMVFPTKESSSNKPYLEVTF